MSTRTPLPRPAASAPVIVRLADRQVFANWFITVYDDPVRFPDGREGSYLRVVQSGGAPGVALLPLHGDRVGLVRVYRYPLGAWEWAIPRGLAHGRSPEATAMTEAEEELGARPARLQEIGRVTPDSGLLASVVPAYAAAYDHEPAAAADWQEVSEIRWLPAGALLEEAAASKMTDSFTLSAMCCAIACGVVPAGASR